MTVGDGSSENGNATAQRLGRDRASAGLKHYADVHTHRRDMRPRRARKLRVAMLAPPSIPVPPPGYGGIEAVVALLCDGLVARGHDVTLFAAPGSRSSARVLTLLQHPHPDEIGQSLHEADHVARAFELIDAAAAAGEPFDVVHDHCGFTGFAMASRLDTPLVHTLHGPFTRDTYAFYARHAHSARVVAISQAQLAQGPGNLQVAGVVPNPIDAARWPFQERKDGYLLWIGRMTEEKGPHRAILAAREAGRPLIMAGPIQPGQQSFFDREVAPHIDGECVRYIGEVGGVAKQHLFAGADALLMPIRWPEPFGMVVIEAMVCGTPVIAFPEGSARELIRDGETGFLVDDEREMAAAAQCLDRVDPAACRETVFKRFDVNVVVAAYELAYATTLAAARPPSVAPVRKRAPVLRSGLDPSADRPAALSVNRSQRRAGTASAHVAGSA
jgi:glycosyltransferase involved in cell wall biosynthesis